MMMRPYLASCFLLSVSTSVLGAKFYYPTATGMQLFETDQSFFRGPQNESIWVSYRNAADPRIEEHFPSLNSSTSRIMPNEQKVSSQAQASYSIDCDANPEVCLNVCYYAYCKSGQGGNGFQQKKRPASSAPVKRAPACAKSPNRCSVHYNPPHNGANYDCDEFPLAAMEAGGTDAAATRCEPASQNRRAGSGFNQIPAGSDVTVVLGGSPPSFAGSPCGPLVSGTQPDCSLDHGQPQLQQ